MSNMIANIWMWFFVNTVEQTILQSHYKYGYIKLVFSLICIGHSNINSKGKCKVPSTLQKVRLTGFYEKILPNFKDGHIYVNRY